MHLYIGYNDHERQENVSWYITDINEKHIFVMKTCIFQDIEKDQISLLKEDNIFNK